MTALAGPAPQPGPGFTLPDVVGLRPGIPAQQAYDFLRAYDPIARVYVSDTPLAAPGQPPLAAKPVPFAIALSQDETNAGELVQADVTLPPSKPTVWRVARRVSFMEGRQPAADTLIASLRGKYGPEAYLVEGRNPALTWYFDEQGRRTALPGGMSPAQCTTMLGPGNALAGVPASHVQQYVLLEPLPDSEQARICRTVVVVHAQLQSSGTDGRLMRQLEVVIADLPLETRAHAATAALLAGGSTSEQQKEDERAGRVPAPKL